MTFEEVMDAYLASRLLQGGLEYRTEASLKRLRPFFGRKNMTDLRRSDVRAYIHRRLAQGVTNSTVVRELRLVSAAINYCRVELDRLDLPNPVSRLGLREPEGRVRWITQQEAGRLISAAEDSRYPYLAPFIRLALNTGCRRGELLDLEWDRADLHYRYLHFEARHTKSRKRQTVPLNDDAVSTLKRLKAWQRDMGEETRWVFGEPGMAQIGALKTGWYAALKQANIENFRIHDLRHTFASWLVMQGESLYVVKELLRHSSIRVTERYAHLAPAQTASAVQRLLPF